MTWIPGAGNSLWLTSINQVDAEGASRSLSPGTILRRVQATFATDIATDITFGAVLASGPDDTLANYLSGKSIFGKTIPAATTQPGVILRAAANTPFTIQLFPGVRIEAFNRFIVVFLDGNTAGATIQALITWETIQQTTQQLAAQ